MLAEVEVLKRIIKSLIGDHQDTRDFFSMNITNVIKYVQKDDKRRDIADIICS